MLENELRLLGLIFLLDRVTYQGHLIFAEIIAEQTEFLILLYSIDVE